MFAKIGWTLLELVMVWSIYMGGCMLLEDMDIDIGLIVWKFMILTITTGLCCSSNWMIKLHLMEQVMSRIVLWMIVRPEAYRCASYLLTLRILDSWASWIFDPLTPWISWPLKRCCRIKKHPILGDSWYIYDWYGDMLRGLNFLMVMSRCIFRTNKPVLKRIFKYFPPNINIRIQFVNIFRIWIFFKSSNILVQIFRNNLVEKH